MSDKFERLFREMKLLPYKEWRFDSANYLEFTISTEQVASLYCVLEKILGAPVKPGCNENVEEIMEFMRNYGGIRANQILYFLREGGAVYYAMIWPWGDQTSATVRVEKISVEHHQ